MMEQVVVDTGRNPRHAVVWLHGLGADGHDFEPIVPQLSAASARAVRFIFPHAPVRPVTINGGLPMRAWYDIFGVDIDRNQDAEGIAASVAAIDALLDEQLAAGIEPHRIILAGFSQGGAIALRCGLARAPALGGVVGLSTYLLGADSLDEWANGNELPPVFMGHGTQDPIVPAALGESSARRLEEAGYAVQWQAWPMAHSVCAEEIAALDAWLDARWS
ncbi:MAG TPA: alpha/beta fold hydrolase [Wenzhouxiangella sp.]|nr:alpha/beta fold hydrolase [Wenzhouxiangella sp.]